MNPYKIWLSEIILQQTQIKQGLHFYEKFTENFPKIEQLAAAEEETVLKLWQGLGYYSRARNLHKTAKIVADRYKGSFPDQYKEILALPGIGEYTAAAIASFAYGQAYPVLDGNVYRFLSRLYDIDLPIDAPATRKVFTGILSEMMAGHDPALFNNAMMEMGAMVCKPASPNCSTCPVSQYCMALKADTIAARPVKSKKVKIRTRYLNFFHIEYKSDFYLEQRKQRDIWQNLFQLPLIETDRKATAEELRERLHEIVQLFGAFQIEHRSEARHLLTHQVLMTDFWYIKANKKPLFVNPDMVHTSLKNHKIYAIPKLIDNYLLLL